MCQPVNERKSYVPERSLQIMCRRAIEFQEFKVMAEYILSARLHAIEQFMNCNLIFCFFSLHFVDIEIIELRIDIVGGLMSR